MANTFSSSAGGSSAFSSPAIGQTFAGSNLFVQYQARPSGGISPSVPPMPPTPPIVIGLSDQDYAALLYGKVIPVFIGGSLLIGGRVVEGPFYSPPTPTGDILVDYVAFHALCADPDEPRTVEEFRLRGQIAWTLANGYVDPAKLPDGGFQTREGFSTQAPLAQSIERHGTGAIAYRGGIITSVRGASMRAFGGILPFPSAKAVDTAYTDGIPRSIAIEKCLRYMRFDPDDFEVNVSGTDSAWIIGAQLTLDDFLRRLRGIFVNYNITYTDKIRIHEPTSFSIAWNLTNRNLKRDTIKFSKTDPLMVPRQVQYGFINKDRDNEPDTAIAQEDVYPQPATSSVESESIELPIVTNKAQADADVHVALYEKMAVAEGMEAVGLTSLWGMEGGDGVRYADHAVIDKSLQVAETQHVYENMQVQFGAAGKLNCGVEGSDATIFIGANSNFGEDEFDQGFGYAPAVADPFGNALPARTFANSLRGMAITDDSIGGNGEAIFVNDSEVHAADFRHVLTDDDYIYYVDVDAGGGSAALIVRISRTDFASRTVLDWGTWFAGSVASGGYAYSATLHAGRIYLTVYVNGLSDTKLVVLDLADFTTSGLAMESLGTAIRTLGMAGLGAYVYLASFDTNSGDNYIQRVTVADNSVDAINGASGGGGRLFGGIADEASGKIFFAPGGKDPSFSYPTVNDRMVGVVDTNITFDDSAIAYFDVTQDANTDFAYSTQNLFSYTPWIVGEKVRLLTQTSADEVRISSFSTDDYTVADSGADLSDYVTVLGAGSGFFPTSARHLESTVYFLLGSNSTSPFVGLLKVSDGYASVEALTAL